MKAAAYGFAILLGFLHALAQAATLSKLWEWFLQPSYGRGPTYAAWYGICVCVSVLFYGFFVNLQRAPQEKGAVAALIRVAALLVVLPILLAVSWCTGQMFGWL